MAVAELSSLAASLWSVVSVPTASTAVTGAGAEYGASLSVSQRLSRLKALSKQLELLYKHSPLLIVQVGQRHHQPALIVCRT